MNEDTTHWDRIHKWQIPNQTVFTVCAPRFLQPIHVGLQNGQPHFWAIITPYEREVVHRFRVVCTGQPFDCARKGQMYTGYVGTFVLDAVGFVGHLFYLGEDES